MSQNPEETETDAGYLSRMHTARAKQQQAHQNHPAPLPSEDAQRKIASDAYRKQTMSNAGMSPAEINEAFERNGAPPPGADGAPIPGTASSRPASRVGGVATKFSVLKATAKVTDHEISPAVPQYGPDWKALKEKIKIFDGTWLVTKFEFQPDVALVLGFFEKPGWEMPKDAEKETFEAIVQGGRVFRTDPE